MQFGLQEHEEKEAENEKKWLEEQDSDDGDGNPKPKVPYDKQEMNMQEFNEEFDGMFPPIDIPDEVAEYVDNDYDLPYSPPNLDGE